MQKWNKPLESQVTEGDGGRGAAQKVYLLYKVCQVLTLPEIPWEVIQRF